MLKPDTDVIGKELSKSGELLPKVAPVKVAVTVSGF
jgi:hypothetical protein